MTEYRPLMIQAIAQALQTGQVGILPTDTVYGLVATVSFPQAKTRIAQLKARDPNKELSIIVKDYQQLQELIKLNGNARRVLAHANASITILGVKKRSYPYAKWLSSSKIAGVRITQSSFLKQLIAVTGPLFATSVNKEGQPPIAQYSELKSFGADFLVFEGKLHLEANQPSRIYNSLTDTWIR